MKQSRFSCIFLVDEKLPSRVFPDTKPSIKCDVWILCKTLVADNYNEFMYRRYRDTPWENHEASQLRKVKDRKSINEYLYGE